MARLMEGKKGLIMGLANDKSIAWGIAKTLHDHGAEIALTYQGEALLKRVKPLAEKLDSDTIIECDVSTDSSIEATFQQLEKDFGKLDFIVHPRLGYRFPLALWF